MEMNADVGAVVGSIMENPELISKIKELLSSAAIRPTEEKAPTRTEEHESESLKAQASKIPDTHYGRSDKRRHQLLCALKPYVSSERAKAIDSMLSFATVLNIIKES